MKLLLIVLLSCIYLKSAISSLDWKLRLLNQYTTIVSIQQRHTNGQLVIVGLNTDGLEILSSNDQSITWETTQIPQQDYSMISNTPKDRLNFENLPFNFITRNIVPFGGNGMAITGRFYYLHNLNEYFNGIAIKEEITSNSWKFFSLPENITDVELIPIHSSFPTLLTWYTVLSKVQTPSVKGIEKEDSSSSSSSSSFLQFDLKKGEFTRITSPEATTFTKPTQVITPPASAVSPSSSSSSSSSTTKQFFTIYKTTSAGEDGWEPILEVKDEVNSTIQDFQCYDNDNCIVLIQKIDHSGAFLLMTKNGGKIWKTIFRSEEENKVFTSLFYQTIDQIWLVGEDQKNDHNSNNRQENNVSKSLLYHSTDGGKNWGMTRPKVQDLQEVFFHSNDRSDLIEGIIVTKGKDSRTQLLQKVTIGGSK